MAHSTITVDADGARLNVTLRGDGPLLVLHPSLGRGAADFAALSESLAEAGYRTAAIDPRGVGESAGASARFTLHDYAEDVRAVIQAIGASTAHLVGHAFGNRVMRCVASDHPDIVDSVMLLACGGKVPPDAETRQHFKRCFDVSLADEDRLPSIKEAFFAPASDPSPWLHGWWACAAASQVQASRRTETDAWWHAGQAPVLVVQGLQDRLAPPANAEAIREDFGERAQIVDVDGAGHAMLPEQPESVSRALQAFLAAR